MTHEIWHEFATEVRDKVSHLFGQDHKEASLKDWHFWHHEDDDVPANDTSTEDVKPEREEVVISNDTTPA